MRFIDEVKIYVSGGHGGNGFVGWRREKYVPMGGPDGGDGGSGGAVVFVASPEINTLIDFSFQPHVRAEGGGAGGGQNLTGHDGEDAVRQVPLGTQVFFRGKLVADLSEPSARWIAARGGHGGKGNAFFRSATNQAPDYSQPGQEGDSFEFTLILKSVADVGLVGFPNVGKSSLITKVSKARPKIADYPFTTLEPNLGVVMLDGGRRIVIADIPGLITGAHEGRGLGIKFLRHVERTSVLAQLIDIGVTIAGDISNLSFETDQEVREAVELQFGAIDHELRSFSETVAGLPRLIVFSKSDTELSRRAYDLTRESFLSRGFEVFRVSSLDGEGMPELLESLSRAVLKQKNLVP